MKANHTSNRQRSSHIKVRISALILVAILAVLAPIFSGCKPEAAPPPVQTPKIEVLAIVPLTGKGAAHGDYGKSGFAMYQKDHPDSRLNLTIIDSESNPQKAVSGFEQQLLLKKPSAAISFLSMVSDTVAPIAEKNKILLIGINTATDTFVEKYSVTQRINDRPISHTAPIAKLTAKKYNKVAVIYANESFGLFCKTTFESVYHQSNNSELILEPYNISDLDQSVVVQRVLAKQPEAIYVAGYGQPYISIFQTLRTFKYGGALFADINFSNPQTLAALGDAANGVIFAAMDFNVSPPSTPTGAAFLEKYQKAFNKEPWLGSAFAYDALAILEHLVEGKQPLERQSIFALREWTGIAAPLSFPSPGECQYAFQFVRRTEGKNVLVDLDKLFP